MEFGRFDLARFATELAAAAANRQVGTSVLFENDRVRVWDLTIAPGERVPFHAHATSYFFVCVSGGRVLSRLASGDDVTMDAADGDTWFTAIDGDDPEIHDLENVGDATVRYVTVELLG